MNFAFKLLFEMFLASFSVQCCCHVH